MFIKVSVKQCGSTHTAAIDVTAVFCVKVRIIRGRRPGCATTDCATTDVGDDTTMLSSCHCYILLTDNLFFTVRYQRTVFAFIWRYKVSSYSSQSPATIDAAKHGASIDIQIYIATYDTCR